MPVLPLPRQLAAEAEDVGEEEDERAEDEVPVSQRRKAGPVWMPRRPPPMMAANEAVTLRIVDDVHEEEETW